MLIVSRSLVAYFIAAHSFMAFFCTALCCTALYCTPVSAQSSSGLRLISVARSPHSRVKPGGVLVVRASVENTAQEVAEGTLVATLEGVPELQSARKVEIAPGSKEFVDLYLQLPLAIKGKRQIEVMITMVVDYGGKEVVLEQDGQPAKYTLSMTVGRLPTLAALFLEPAPTEIPYWHWPFQEKHNSFEFAVASRIDSGSTRQTSSFAAGTIPISLSDWDAIDVAVISEPKTFSDAAVVASVKHFISSGGRVWIMLDRVPSEAIRPLLGANQLCETIDVVELNTFQVDVVGGNAQISDSDRKVDSKTPLRMKRVIQHGGSVTHRVNGWPAAIRMQVGYGELVITTLDSAAWIEQRANPSDHPLYQAEFTTRIWGKQFAADVNVGRLDGPLSSASNYALEHIGNPVVPRSWVATALVGFCLLLGILGAWRSMLGDLNWLGILAPSAAVVASAGLLIASGYVRRDIPESVSSLQVVQVSEDGNSATVREQAAVHLSSAVDMNLESKLDGRAVADEMVSTGIRRFEITDFQQWRLSNASWPPGSWRYQTQFSLPANNSVVRAELTSRGVRLEMPELPSPLEDPVLGYSVGDAMLCSSAGDNALLVDGSQSASGGRWIAGTLIDDEQQRRMDVYQQFFVPNDRRRSLRRVLYGWTEHWPGGPEWSREMQQNGSALVALPVRLERPKSGDPVFIPHGLVQLRQDPTAEGKTIAYSDVSGRWTPDLTMAIKAPFQFVLPPETVPFEAKAIELELDIKAPKRNVRVLFEAANGEPVEIMRLQSPSIPSTTTITQPQVLQAARDGVLSFLVEVTKRTDLAQGESSSTIVSWGVDHFHADFRGTVAEASNLAKPTE